MIDVRADVFGKAWAIVPGTLSGLAAPASASFRTRPIRATARLAYGPHGAVGVIPIQGVLTPRGSFLGTSIQGITGQFRSALADRSVSAIVFDIDSPGGDVVGIPELADEIFRARGQKKTVAVANCSALAGAYWLASAAKELVIAPSGEAGGIGIVTAHQDNSVALEKEGLRISLISAGRHKTDGNPYEPLSDYGRADMQTKANSFYGMFVTSVARGRGVSPAAVRGGFGQGRSVLAHQAVAKGMADGVETLDQVLARLASGRPAERAPLEACAPIALLRRELELMGG